MPRSTHAAATVIQKAFRGHSDSQHDSKVEELKAEVRELRSEEHIKYLTKELSSAKSALEQERKLRALQMDAIKVLWKEVQMMDATKGGREADKSRPSGSIGSKISSRFVRLQLLYCASDLGAGGGGILALCKSYNLPSHSIGCGQFCPNIWDSFRGGA